MNANPRLRTLSRSSTVAPCWRCDAPFAEHKERCPSCRAWRKRGISSLSGEDDQTILLDDVAAAELERISVGHADAIFGGGLTIASTNLIGGEPGAGKSTLALQLCDIISSKAQRETIYISAEERSQEVKSRATRLQLKNTKLIRLYPIGATASLGDIIVARKPACVIVDSLPGLTDDPEEAVRFCKRLKELCVESLAPAIIIDHVTKQDDIAGLMALQHAVDAIATLFCTGDGEEREMTVRKNRNGPANHSIYWEMTASGLIPKLPVDEGEAEDGSSIIDDELDA